jgi:hypothetical protein
MAFSYSILKMTIEGVNKKVYGKFANSGGSTGGDITTGLGNIIGFTMTYSESSAGYAEPTVNETFPLNNAGGVVTIVTPSNLSGTFIATGS